MRHTWPGFGKNLLMQHLSGGSMSAIPPMADATDTTAPASHEPTTMFSRYSNGLPDALYDASGRCANRDALRRTCATRNNVERQTHNGTAGRLVIMGAGKKILSRL